MSDQPPTTHVSQTAAKSSCACGVIFTLILLRVSVGWHFLSEGSEKISYDPGRNSWHLDFSSEWFLQGAKGPLAPLYHNQVPGSFGWQSTLAVPRQLTPEKGEQLNQWVAGYVSRRQKELKTGKQSPADLPEFAPYYEWAKRIESRWRTTQKQFTTISALDKEQHRQSADVLEEQLRQLADYLAGESLDIQDYQHQLWRLSETQSAPGAKDIPYRQERIGQKMAETSSVPRKWVAGVRQLHNEFANDLRQLLTDEQRSSQVGKQVEKVLTDPDTSRLRWIDWSVTALNLGVGVCLLMGLFTRLAAVCGALFLLSVMVTQPPWVADANTTYFYYQLVEFSALLLLAATAAGRWAGIDYIIHGLWSKCCGSTKG